MTHRADGGGEVGVGLKRVNGRPLANCYIPACYMLCKPLGRTYLSANTVLVRDFFALTESNSCYRKKAGVGGGLAK